VIRPFKINPKTMAENENILPEETEDPTNDSKVIPQGTNVIKDPDKWDTDEEPVKEAQRSHLRTLTESSRRRI
jgi:hypothetical protein